MNYPNKETPKKTKTLNFQRFNAYIAAGSLGGAIEKIRTRIR